MQASDTLGADSQSHKNISAALQFYMQVLELDSENKKAIQGISSIIMHYVDAARVALASGDIALAEEHLSHVWTLDSNNIAAYSVRAQLAETRLAMLLEKIKMQQEEMHEVYIRQRQVFAEKNRTESETDQLLEEIDQQQQLLSDTRQALKAGQEQNENTEKRLETLLSKVEKDSRTYKIPDQVQLQNTLAENDLPDTSTSDTKNSISTDLAAFEIQPVTSKISAHSDHTRINYSPDSNRIIRQEVDRIENSNKRGLSTLSEKNKLKIVLDVGAPWISATPQYRSSQFAVSLAGMIKPILIDYVDQPFVDLQFSESNNSTYTSYVNTDKLCSSYNADMIFNVRMISTGNIYT